MTSAMVLFDKNSGSNNEYQPQQQRHSIAWDPSNPSALLIVSNDDDDHRYPNPYPNTDDTHNRDITIMNVDKNDNNNKYNNDDANISHDHLQFHTWYADTGNVDGILPSYELTALLRLISDYESRMQQQQQQPSLQPQSQPHLMRNMEKWSYREQSQRYRNTISELLWDLDKNRNENEESSAGEPAIQKKELLQEINSILYLSEIYLLPPPQLSSLSSSSSSLLTSPYGKIHKEPEERSYFYSDGTVRNWFDCPGIATADTIRFLRQYELPPPISTTSGRRHGGTDDMMDDVNDEEEGEDVEYLVSYGDFPSDEAFWEQILLYCKYGYLDLVWKMLETFPFYIESWNALHMLEDENEDVGRNTNDLITRATCQSFIHDWKQIGSVLLTAPIPGGRCAGTTTDSFGEETLLSDDDIDLSNVAGLNVRRTDHQYWDVPTSSSSSIDQPTVHGDQPMIYMPEVAKQKHQLWSDYVKHVRTHNRACKRHKYLDILMQILSGDFGSMKYWCTSDHNNNEPPIFSSWSEQLCCELLYRTPDLRPRSIASRTAIIMKQYNNREKATTYSNDATVRNADPHPSKSMLSAYQGSIIAIMQGNAGRTITELYDLGGGSGAAVPRTLMALVFDLFVEAKIIPQESIEKRCEFLTEASSSIVASSRVSDPDMGVQLAIRLLLPHLTMTAAPLRGEFAAAIANILEHYTPMTDQYARTTLSLCIPVLSTVGKQSKNRQRQWQRTLLDGCVCVLIQLYRKFEQQCDHSQTVDMTLLLLEGIDMESDLLPQAWLGTCYRFLEAECSKTCLPLLQVMSSSSNEEAPNPDPYLITKADAMSIVIERYLLSAAASTGGKSEATSTEHRSPSDGLPASALLLVNAVEMFKLFVADKDHHELAKQIAAFLSKCILSSTSTSMCLRLWVLRVARSLIEKGTGGIFDPSVVTTLLQHISIVKSWSEITRGDSNTGNEECIGSVSDINAIQLCFHGLLLNAVCNQNVMKKKNRTNALQQLESTRHRGLYSETSVQTRKELVRNMLH